jgi:5-methylcytosine-specific restriction protein A
MMPFKPEKKIRPWIPRKKKRIDILNYNRSRSGGDMLAFYQSKKWRSLRNYKIQMNPLCELCEAKGLTESAKEVDHILAIKDGGEMLSYRNLQSLCRSCHASKSAKEREARKHIKKYY